MKQSLKIENFVVYLITLLKNQNKDSNIAIIQLRKVFNISKKIEEEDLIKILTIKMNLANVVDCDQFINSTQFEIKKSIIYFRVMQDPNTIKWVRVMREKLDQLYKNKIQTLVY